MAVDGSCMGAANEAANADFFGCPTASRGHSAHPQARVLSLAARIAPSANFSTVLRNKMTALIEQKLWSLLLAHYATCKLIERAAW